MYWVEHGLKVKYKMKKILLVSSGGFEKGGVQAVIMALVRTLSKEYIFDIVLLSNEKGYYEEEFCKYGGNIYRIEYEVTNKRVANLKSFICFPIKLKRFIKKLIIKNSYDIIHFNCGIMAGPALKMCKNMKIESRIIHIHGMVSKVPFGIKSFPRFITNKIYVGYLKKYSNVRLACSKEAGESIFAKNGFMCINNPIEDKFFSPKIYSKSEELNLLQVGYFTPNKNQLFSLEIVKELINKNINVKITFIGFDVGGYIYEIRKYIEANGLCNNVEILEHDTDVCDILDKMDFLLFPSISEGFGMVLVEAQARGVKCFASENISKQTNLGGVTYLPLSEGSVFWAEKIIDEYYNMPEFRYDFNCEKYSYNRFKNEFKMIYENKRASIITFFNADNFGAVLQCYALQKAISKFGIKTNVAKFKDPAFKNSYKVLYISKRPSKMIKYLRQAPSNFIRKQIFNKFRNQYFNMSSDLCGFDYYICGSDQIWNMDITCGYNPMYFCGVDSDNKKAVRFSYAASIGKSKLDEKEKEVFSDALNKLDYISVREDSAKEMIQCLTSKEIQVMPDPTLLLERSEWGEFLNRKNNGDYILIYSICNSQKVFDFSEEISSKYSLPIIEIKLVADINKKKSSHKVIDDIGPIEFINYINNAKYIVTDSFHGTVFSLIFNKEFYSIVPLGLGSRVRYLLNRIGLTERLISSDEYSICTTKIDFAVVNEKLNEMRLEGENFLKSIFEVL